ncbi:hypothetical protein ACLI4R_16480 [Natrialbaceae archaeon A-chndr2]
MSDDEAGETPTDGPNGDPRVGGGNESRTHERGQQVDRTTEPVEPDRIPVATADERNRYTESAQSAAETGTASEEFGPEPSDRIIEPESPSLENAIFVLLGAVLMILIMFRLQSVVGF